MSTVVVKRPPRVSGPEAPEGQVELAEPPALGEPASVDFTSALIYLPMLLGVGAMAMMFTMGASSPTTFMMSGMMGTAMLSMAVTQIGRRGAERKRKMRSERRDYLRYLAQLRRQVRHAAAEQRAAAYWNNPHPQDLWAMASGQRLWERRGGHEDFAEVRVGLGSRRAGLVLAPPETKPVEDLEPLSAISLRRFTKAYQNVTGLPVTVPLRRFTSVELAGDGEAALGLLRALIGRLAVGHAPDEMRIALLTDAVGRTEWDWLKWLPHNAHPTLEDETGPLRLASDDHDLLMDLLGPEVTERPEHDPGSSPRPGEPFVVVLAYRAYLPETSRLLAGGLRNVVLLDATGAMTGGPDVLRLTARDGEVEFPSGDTVVTARADTLTPSAAEELARVLAPMRTGGGGVELVEQPLETDFDLATLLGVRDPRSFDVASLWRTRTAQSTRLRVPIGLTEDNEVLELDLKESAQAGMGPHGLLIGATGSGKSELVRTLVIGLAATHSSDILNFVLVDFKGGATFLNMDRLPHTSAVITNLADELHLVDRMRDSLQGEMTRRQELLRESGHSSLYDYEKARLGGAPLTPLPSLVIVVDEFSELLANKPEFVDLFVSIGRLGRSLGVHLLLASQRLDEGRIHRVEGHLSYRIALRTFSSMESRSVIGVGSAYELPSAPGNGFLKVDTTNLARFKAAYVSGAAPESPGVSRPAETAAGSQEIVAFGMEQRHPVALETAEGAEPQAAQQTPPAESASENENEESLLEVLVDRLEGAGPPARQVWLPPLDHSPSLDQLLPGIVPDPERGMSAADYPALGGLRVPLGMVDRPYEQLRELLVADLSGADGHLAIAGAPQSGKSTTLRTLMLALALTHTPREVQFYCLDFGGGGLQSTAGLPHVGSVATRMERDRVTRTVEELSQLLETRERRFTESGLESMTAYRQMRDSGQIDDPYGDVFLVIDNWGTLKQDFEDLEPRITDLAARGLSFGLHVVASAVRWSEIRPRARDLFGTKLELRLGDTVESELGSKLAASVPQQPGRGLTKTKFHFLAALPRLDSFSGTDDLTAATRSAVAEIDTFWTGRQAPGVRMLPAKLPLDKLPAPEGDLRVALGWDEQRLAPVWHDFGVAPHLMVFGDAETGKTNVLRLTIDAITRRYQPDEARILLADTRRDLLSLVPEEYRVGFAVDGESLTQLAGSAAVSVGKRVPGPDIAPERLPRRDWWTGPQLFMLIDDYDLYGGGPGSGSPLNALAPMLAHSVNIGLHLVISRSTSGAGRAMMDPVIRRIWELGNPALLHSYPKEEGKFIGEARPRTLPPGRAQLVTRRGVRLMQVGYAGP
ncbi:type VII secretion protein EccCa [Streptomyces sp. NPDC101393]|uniref:type VII secretion protein EccCa n=1 Tax=Streptomyces sp. NPDC101393 TaxID=3366141 RepID=UPI00382131F7